MTAIAPEYTDDAPQSAIVSDDDTDEPTPQDAQGPLLDEPDLKKVAASIIAKVDAQKKDKARLGAMVRRNCAWGRGVRGVRIVEDTDQSDYRVTAPIGSKNASPVPNKVAELIEKTVALLTADRASPDVQPASGDDDDVNAAEFQTRLLVEDGGSTGSNDTALARWGLMVAGYYRSAFLYAIVDPSGGGRHPVEIHCAPNAEQFDPANPASAMIDPMAGSPVADEAAVIKYLHPDNTLRATKAGAQQRWVNKVVADVITSETVWLHPPTCRGIDDAEAVTVGRVVTLGQAKSMFPKLAEMDNAALTKLCAWRPSSNVRGWLPASMDEGSRKAVERGSIMYDADGKTLSDQNLLFGFHHYERQSDLYPRGAYVCVFGGTDVPERSPWSKTIGDGDDAEDVALELPLAQVRWKDDPIDRDPMGIAGAEELGAMDELRASQMLAALEWLFRFNRPIQYLPAGSPLQGKSVAQARETQNYVPVNMDGSGRPISEEIPPLPPLVLQIYAGVGEEMEQRMGVPKSLQGLTQSGVNSGKMQNQQIEQAMQTLAPIFQNVEDALCRWWRIKSQLWRAFYDVPRLAKLGSEGGSYELKAWSGTDLSGAGDIQIKRGTFTAMTAGAKRQMAAEELSLALTTKDPEIIQDAWQRYKDVAQSGLSAKLGLEDDPVEQRIKRQLSAFQAGPTPELVQQSQQYQQAQQQQQAALQQAAQAAQSLGQEPPQAPPPQPDPMVAAAQAIFAPISSDDFPGVAKVRVRALVNAQQQRRYENAPMPWRQGLDEALDRAKQASGIQTIAEQQSSQQQAVQTQQQGEQQTATVQSQLDTQKGVTIAQAQAQADLQVQRENDERDTARVLLEHELEGDRPEEENAPDFAGIR